MSKASNPLFGDAVVLVAVGQVLVGDGADERVVGVRVGEQRADGEEHFRDGERRRPVVFEYVQADGALRVHVAVVDACFECHFWRLEWVVRCEVDVQVEDSTLVDRSSRTIDSGEPLVNIIAFRTGAAIGRWIERDLGELLLDALGRRAQRVR